MKISKGILLILFLSIFCLKYSIGQNYLTILDSAIVNPIKKAEQCLERGDSACYKYFRLAIDEANRQGDSVSAMTYKEIVFSIFNFGTPEDCRKLIKTALTEVDSLRFPGITSIYYRRMGMTYMRTEVFDSVFPYLDKSLELARMAHDTLQIGITYLTTADAYHLQGKTKRGLEILTEAKPFAEKGSEFTKIGLIFIAGSIYLTNKDYEQARLKYEEAMDATRSGSKNIYFMAMINWAVAMNELNKPRMVADSLPQAIKHFKGTFQEHPAKAQLSHALYLLGDHRKSLDLALEELNYKPQLDYQFITLNRKLAARNYLALNNPVNALENASLALENELERKDLDEELIEAYILKAEALKLNNRTEEAYNILNKSIELNDSLFAISKQKEILNLQEYYETEMRESKIDLQQKDISLLQARSKVDKLQKIQYAFGMMAFAMISLFLYFISRQRIRKKEQERKKQQEVFDQKLNFKKKELASQTLHLLQKNSFIQELNDNLENLKNIPKEFDKDYKRIQLMLKREAASDNYWEAFKTYFKEVHNDFDKKIQSVYPGISEKELRLASFLKMNLSTKEIADLMNVLPDSVLKSKYRLKQKLNLDKEQDLYEYLLSL
ncbi:tetratricopeptide repeat protein [Carboxylicivirga caseinilyticus]|uniref:tetratricopeptide repeat protein n=1 Tax=Carboxylicivirga caseinilyticus TaxID=3417572 RepID=UPI003D32A541|nr:hypothetical protein [Marinilabiliaceae bacterium A049]